MLEAAVKTTRWRPYLGGSPLGPMWAIPLGLTASSSASRHLCRERGGGGALPPNSTTQTQRATQQRGRLNRHARSVPQQTCLLCHTAVMFALLRSRHVSCVAARTCLLSHTADIQLCHTAGDMSCCVTEQTRLLSHTADMSAVRDSRHVCCVTQQTCLPCGTADMSAV